MQKQRQQNVIPLPKPFRRPEPQLPAQAAAAPVLVPFPRWQKACERVGSALLGGETRVVVTGPPGTGKTLLLDHIARVLRAAGWTVMIRLAEPAAPSAPPGRAAVLIDEADRLPPEALQRLLAMTPGPLVLAGLDALAPHVPDAIQITLGALTREEARDYIASWLVLTGRTPDNLEAAAMRRIVVLSGGVPRLLSTVLAAASWLAESSEETVITVARVEEAAELRSCFAPAEVEPGPAAEHDAPARGRVPILVVAAMVLLAGAAFIATRSHPLETQRAFSSLRRMVERIRPVVTVPPQPAPPAAALPAPARQPAPAPRATAPEIDLPEIDAPAPRRAEPAAPPPAPSAIVAPLEPPHHVLPAAMISLLVQRGRDMMAIGDITAARLLFGRAAEAGDAEAMLDMGKTYDPAILAEASPLLQPSLEEAGDWYRRAIKAGNQEAAARLAQLPRNGRPR